MSSSDIEDLDLKTVEDYLNDVVYSANNTYCPSDFALEFVTFIKLINGAEGEENETPVMHFNMLDTAAGKNPRIVNLCARGTAKTTLLGEYLFLYLAVYGDLPKFKNINLAIYVSDSIENGVKNMRKNLEYRWENSDFLRQYLPKTKFTDIRWEFNNIDGKKFIVKGYGAKCNLVSANILTDTGSVTIGDCQVGDRIFGPDGQLTTITYKSPVQHKKMYRITLRDGRTLDVTHDHINSVVIPEYSRGRSVIYKGYDLDTETLRIKISVLGGEKVYIRNTAPLVYSHKTFLLDPYTLGILLGDGDMPYGGAVRLMGLRDDVDHYAEQIPYTLGKQTHSIRGTTRLSRLGIVGIYPLLEQLGIRGQKGENKVLPEAYLYGSIGQRLAVLRGLMDTDGSVTKEGYCSFTNISESLCSGVTDLVRSLGGTVTKTMYLNREGNRKDLSKLHIKIAVNPFSLPRKQSRWCLQSNYSDLLRITRIAEIPTEASQCIAVDNDSHQFLVDDYFRTHNTGVRGSKELGTRPQLAVLDDLISDEDARSETVRNAVEDTVYKAVNFALHPIKNVIIWSGTPFNAKDPLYKAVESGAWAVNVFPVCEQFPCSRKDFRSAWPDRFTFDYVKAQYELALKTGKVDAFNQEMMLRIMSDEDRLILDCDISWYKRNPVIQNKQRFNFYITTDFATGERDHNDFSVISVWAYNNNGDWLWVDGVCQRQTMDKNINDLFRMAQRYKPQLVGIEVSGQQGGFIPWIQEQMMVRNVWFPLASENNRGSPGVRPVPNTKKIERFNVVVPWFKMNKVFFPVERKDSPEIQQAINELSLVSRKGFRSKHDDFCISGNANIRELLPNGTIVSRRVDQLCNGALVRGYDEDTGTIRWVEVQNFLQTGIEQTYSVTDEAGDQIHLTGNHPVLTQRGWVHVSDLLITDMLVRQKCKLSITDINGLKGLRATINRRLTSLMGHVIGYIKKFT